MSRTAKMADSSSSRQQQIRLFRSEWLEKLTIITPVGFIAAWSVLVPALIWLAWGTTDTMTASVLVLGGFAFWGLFEYSMHRFVFHWKPKNDLLRSFVFIMHGNHHADPNDPLRNLMPLVASIPITGTVWLAMYGLLGAKSTWAFVGFIIGYIIYDMLHYACHQWPMKGRMWTVFKKHHMRHHHARKEGNYAISTLFFDRLFGTRVVSLKAAD